MALAAAFAQDALQRLASSRQRWLNHPTFRRFALWIAITLLIAGLVIALRAQPLTLADLDWRPLAALFFLVIPVVKTLNVFEYQLTGRLLGRRIGFLEGLEVTTIGAAANMLPLPGSTIVRVAGLKAAGAGAGKGTGAVLLVYLLWLAVAAAYAGAWILAIAPGWIGPLMLAAGVALLGLSWLIARGLRGQAAAVSWLALNRLGLVALEALRFVLALAAMGVAASFAQASGLTVSGVLGSALSVVPAGLGLRELVAAGLGPVVGIAAAAGFLAAGLNRLLDLAFILVLAGALALRRQWSGKVPLAAGGLFPDSEAGRLAADGPLANPVRSGRKQP